MSRLFRIVMALQIALIFSPESADPARGGKPVRLVLAITVDQLRGSAVSTAQIDDKRPFLDRLVRRGVHFANAHYAHANTLTAPGHATLFTGAHAAGYRCARRRPRLDQQRMD